MPQLRRARSVCAHAAIAVLLTAAAAVPSIAAPSRSSLEAARAKLMELERDFQLVSEEYNLVNERLIDTQARIAAARLEIARVERRMSGRQSAAIALARELYKGGSSLAVESLLSSKSLADMDLRLRYLQTSKDAQARVFERLVADRSLLDQEVRVLEVSRRKVAADEARLAELRDQIEEKAASQRDEIAELNAALEAAEARAAQATARPSGSNPPTSGNAITSAPAPNPRAQAAVDAALSQVGKPYQWGAAGPDSYDCSGLSMWAWAHAGVSLPHNSGMQYAATPRVARSDWAPGDLLFFGNPIHHLGIYIGNGQMVEAPYTGSQVRVVPASRSDYAGAGRPG